MPRSPLLRGLLRAISRARAAHVGVPIAPPALARTSRRTWLTSAAVAVASAGAACGRARSPEPKGERVAIVGAGLAGLHCAYRLQQLGIHVSVYDAAARIGGRLLTDRKTFAGQHAEIGGELIDTDHATMHELGRELGIPLFDYRSLAAPPAAFTANFGGVNVSEAELVAEFSELVPKLERALAALRDRDGYITYRDLNGGAELDAMSIRDWLDRAEVSGTMRSLLEVAYTCEYGLPPDESNALNLVWLISSDARRFEIYGDSDERFHASTGSDSYAAQLLERLQPGTVALHERLVSLRALPDGRVRLGFAAGAATREHVFDRVVLALPFSLLREVRWFGDCPDVKRRAIRELTYGRNSKLICAFRERFWQRAGATGATFTDRTFQSTWEASRLQPGASGILTNFLGGAPATDLARGELRTRTLEFVRELERVLPGAEQYADGRSTRFVWPKYPLTYGSYSAYRVGDYARFAGAEGERVGRIHFCGEHTSPVAQGYMEGAALSGAIAAVEVASDLGLRVERLVPPGPAARILRRATALHAERLAAD